MSARPDTWMPIYWGDYARDTGHLSAAGHGAYLMLIKHYWCTGRPLANDDDELWRIACCDSKREWLKLRPKVVRLFREDGTTLRHKRVDEELAKASANNEAKSRAGAKGAQKRWHKHGRAIAEPSVRDRPTDATSPSPLDAASAASARATEIPVQEGGEADQLREYLEAVGDKGSGQTDISALTALASRGYDWHRDVLAVVRGKAPSLRKPVSPSYFVPIIVERHRVPEKPPDKPTHPVTWVAKDDPRWDELAALHEERHGKRPNGIETSGHEGVGWYFEDQLVAGVIPQFLRRTG